MLMHTESCLHSNCLCIYQKQLNSETINSTCNTATVQKWQHNNSNTATNHLTVQFGCHLLTSLEEVVHDSQLFSKEQQ